MKRYIVREQNGFTGLLELRDDQSYHGAIIWDESKDGPIPENIKGKERFLKLSQGKLVVDTPAKEIFDADLQDKSDKKAVKDSRLTNFKNFNGNDAGAGAMLLKLLEHFDLK